MIDKEKKERAVEAARVVISAYNAQDDIIVDNGADVEEALPEGVWVRAWVFVPRGDIFWAGDLSEKCREIYESSHDGQAAVERFIRENYPEIPWLPCAPCEDETPSHEGACLVCGTTN